MADIKLPKLKSVSEIRKKKKILLLSDDLRMSSGVGTMSREFVLGTLDKYDWVQVAGAIKHPEKGQVVDMNESVRKETGIKDASLKIFPVDGYGDQELIRFLIKSEKPDAILHYTDPRFWRWLYEMEHEIRQHIPIFYYNIWDDYPYPRWNQPFYESCDLIMNISKQTVNIVRNVCEDKPRTDWDCTYSPHGINEKDFYIITEEKERLEMNKFRNDIFKGKPIEFSLLYVNRNIRRKMPGDCVLAFKHFWDQLPEDKRDKVGYIMHTSPVDENGTDLPALIEELAPDCNIVFSGGKLDNKHMNFLYNITDVTMNIASNEGFGLGTAESLMGGTPIIVNVTGGMQDQCGFKLDGKFLTYKDYYEVETLHDWKKWENNDRLTWGEWAKPVWPKSRALMGSIQTPYIFDDRCDWRDAGDAIKYWYDMGKEKRTECGKIGRDWVCSDESMMSGTWMSKNFIDHMETAFKKWTPKSKFSIYKV
jgi:glycosyltransferase involved in cell wall biosynthesis|tara:strand:+ start:269 stop:1702 length:1434 start_codon:yes stop_codon:yes gene_type:complete